jgi:hypothetical protein
VPQQLSLATAVIVVTVNVDAMRAVLVLALANVIHHLLAVVLAVTQRSDKLSKLPSQPELPKRSVLEKNRADGLAIKGSVSSLQPLAQGALTNSSIAIQTNTASAISLSLPWPV